MPELPEVETTCRDLKQNGGVNQIIKSVDVLWPKSLSNFEGARLIGATISHISRRGKYIVLTLDSGATLLIHLRMTGSLRIEPIESEMDPYDRVVINFENQKLAFRDPRKFGRLTLTEEAAVYLDKLGIEPLSAAFTAPLLFEMLQKKHKQLKALLLEQSFIAGLGNIYADEVLFAARLNPMRTAASVTLEEATLLHSAIVTILTQAIENRGTSLGDGKGNYSSNGKRGGHAARLKIFRKQGQPCPVCGTKIEKIVVAQRSTHFCPECQK
ncbi:MAG: DNA-formamidopyrimidine glycosylase [Sphaerochaetaceae bacterium]